MTNTLGTQQIFGIAAFCTFGLGILLFIIYKAIDLKTVPNKTQLIGYFGKGLIAMTILLNILGNFYGGKYQTEELKDDFIHL